MSLTLSRARYDLLHIHFPHPMGVAAYIASLKPSKHRVVVTYHSDIVKQARLLQAYRPLMHRVLRRADAIICTSDAYAATSEDLQPYLKKCRTIPYGVDPIMQADSPQIDQAVAQIRQHFSGPLILAVGRLVYYKGFEFLIKAMPKIPGATCLIVGDGPLRAQLEALTDLLGLRGRVHFLGEFGGADLVPYYRAAQVFAFPSIARSEAFGIVQLEAMANGVPVVNTALDSGVPHVSLHERTGLTVAPRDPDALAVAVSRLISDEALRVRFGNAGREGVRTGFSGDVMCRKVLDLYRELAS
jgi:rhamnosyl/mannosyltransferase